MEYKVVNPIPEEDMKTILYTLNKNMEWETFEHVGEGCFGSVFRYKDYAIKITDIEEEDGKILKNLQGTSYYPILYFYGRGKTFNFMVSEFIKGRTFEMHNTFDKNITEEYYLTFKEAIQFALDKGLVPRDLNSENHMVRDGKCVIVDVGRFHPKEYGETIEDFTFDIHHIKSYIKN